MRERAAAMDCASGARMEVGVKEVMEGRLPPATLSVVAEVEVAMEGRLWAISTPAAAAAARAEAATSLTAAEGVGAGAGAEAGAVEGSATFTFPTASAAASSVATREAMARRKAVVGLGGKGFDEADAVGVAVAAVMAAVAAMGAVEVLVLCTLPTSIAGAAAEGAIWGAGGRGVAAVPLGARDADADAMGATLGGGAVPAMPMALTADLGTGAVVVVVVVGRKGVITLFIPPIVEVVGAVKDAIVVAKGAAVAGVVLPV